MDKPNVGDAAVLKSGSQFVIREVHDRHPEHTLPEKYQWYAVGDRPNNGGVWDQYIDHIIPAEKSDPEFQKGDKVRLTPKAGGETVIVGEVYADWTDVLDVTPGGTEPYIAIQKADWNIEKITPSTVDILNGLGENAFVAHRTSVRYYGYYKHGGQWHSADESHDDVSVDSVAYWVDTTGFEIIFEGAK